MEEQSGQHRWPDRRIEENLDPDLDFSTDFFFKWLKDKIDKDNAISMNVLQKKKFGAKLWKLKSWRASLFAVIFGCYSV